MELLTEETELWKAEKGLICTLGAAIYAFLGTEHCILEQYLAGGRT